MINFTYLKVKFAQIFHSKSSQLRILPIKELMYLDTIEFLFESILRTCRHHALLNWCCSWGPNNEHEFCTSSFWKTRAHVDFHLDVVNSETSNIIETRNADLDKSISSFYFLIVSLLIQFSNSFSKVNWLQDPTCNPPLHPIFDPSVRKWVSGIYLAEDFVKISEKSRNLTQQKRLKIGLGRMS